MQIVFKTRWYYTTNLQLQARSCTGIAILPHRIKLPYYIRISFDVWYACSLATKAPVSPTSEALCRLTLCNCLLMHFTIHITLIVRHCNQLKGAANIKDSPHSVALYDGCCYLPKPRVSEWEQFLNGTSAVYIQRQRYRTTALDVDMTSSDSRLALSWLRVCDSANWCIQLMQ